MGFAAFVISIVALVLSVGAIWYVSRAVGEVIRSNGPSASVGQKRAQARFRLQQVTAHRYVLRNDGGAVARHVRVEPGDLAVHEGEMSFDSFPPGRTEEYLFFQPLQGRVSEIVVTWRDDGLDVPRIESLPLNSHVVHIDDQSE